MVPLPPIKAPIVRVPTDIPSHHGESVTVEYEIHSGTDSELKSEVVSEADEDSSEEQHDPPPAVADSGVTLRISRKTPLLIVPSSRLRHQVPLPNNKRLYLSSRRSNLLISNLVDPI